MVPCTVTPTCSPPNPKSKYLNFPCATCFDAIFWRSSRLATPIPLFCVRYTSCLHCYVCVKLDSACVRTLSHVGAQIPTTSSNPSFLSTICNVWLWGWPDRARDCGCGPSACICKTTNCRANWKPWKISSTSTRFFWQRREFWKGSPCSANANSFPPSYNHCCFGQEYGRPSCGYPCLGSVWHVFFERGQFFHPTGEKTQTCLHLNKPPCNHIGFQHVPMAILGGREVDMPYGLWEDLHQQVVRTDNAQFLKTNHPMLHVFYKSMEAQLCAITRCRPKMHRKTLAVPKFFG